MRFNILTAPDNIDYVLLNGPEYRVTQDGFEMTADYGIKAVDLPGFIQELYGLVMVSRVPISQMKQDIHEPKMFMSVSGPHQNTLKFWCDGVSASPWSRLIRATDGDALQAQKGSDVSGVAGGPHVPVGARGIPNCEYYKVSAHYTDRDPFVEELFNHDSEVSTISCTDLYWKLAGPVYKKVDQETDRPLFIKTNGEWDYSIKRTRVIPEICFSMRGKVNSEKMWSRHMFVEASSGSMVRKSYAAGTVLYKSFFAPPVFVPWGNSSASKDLYVPYYRLDYRFLINEAGWNKFPYTGQGSTKVTFENLATLTPPATYTAYSPFESADLRLLQFNPNMET